MEKLNIKTTKRIELVDITADVHNIISKKKIKDGVCLLFCPHTTAGLTINENADPAVRSDMVSAFSKFIPVKAGYEHSEGNSDSHIKSSIFGSSLTLFVEGGQLALGTWQGIFFCESDGPRSREIWFKVVENSS